MKLFSLIILLFSCLAGVAQDPTPPSELEGLELREWLRSNWYQTWHNDLGYSEARIAMYSTIDVEGGNIECVYSGFTQPATFNSFPNPINTEHTVPQSFFDSELPMRSDIHHLFPTHGDANNDRGNLPFGEVVDLQADSWLIGSAGNYSSSSDVPSSEIEDYSEVYFNNSFEPREENKGNIARAVFYFYTMYATDTEPGYEDISSAGNLNTLYSWHVMDPPDAIEIERDEEVQDVQGNYNPYIRMPELAAPAWGFISEVDEYEIELQVIVDQNSRTIKVINQLEISKLSLMNCLGQVLRSEPSSSSLFIENLVSGIYILRVETAEGQYGIKKLFIR